MEPASRPSTADSGGASAGQRSPLVPPFLALCVLLALQFAAQLFQVGLGIVSDADYRPPYPLAHMSKRHSDFDMLDAANTAYVAGAPDFDSVRQQARQLGPLVANRRTRTGKVSRYRDPSTSASRLACYCCRGSREYLHHEAL